MIVVTTYSSYTFPIEKKVKNDNHFLVSGYECISNGAMETPQHGNVSSRKCLKNRF